MITPTPDIPPHTGHAPITYVAYTYDTPAVIRGTTTRIPGWWYHCRVPVNGRRVCVLFRR